jgi:hypothetical protein
MQYPVRLIHAKNARRLVPPAPVTVIDAGTKMFLSNAQLREPRAPIPVMEIEPDAPIVSLSARIINPLHRCEAVIAPFAVRCPYRST